MNLRRNLPTAPAFQKARSPKKEPGAGNAPGMDHPTRM